jgi:hypothetical protein
MQGHLIQTWFKSNTILIWIWLIRYMWIKQAKLPKRTWPWLATARPVGRAVRGQEIKHALGQVRENSQ